MNLNQRLGLEGKFFDIQTIGMFVIAFSWTVLVVGLVMAKGGSAAAAALAFVASVIPLPIGLVWTKWLTRQLRKRRSAPGTTRDVP